MNGENLSDLVSAAEAAEVMSELRQIGFTKEEITIVIQRLNLLTPEQLGRLKTVIIQITFGTKNN